MTQLNTSQLLALAGLGIIIASLAFAAGWNFAVRRHRKQQLKLAARYEELAENFDKLSTQVKADPVRLGINTGMEYVINEVTNVLEQLRPQTETAT